MPGIKRVSFVSATITLVLAGLLCLILLLVTRQWFIERYYLPQLNSHFGYQASASNISIHPLYSEIAIRDLSLSTGEAPWFTAKFILLDFTLSELLFGNLKIDDIKVQNGKVALLQNERGQWNVVSDTSHSKPKAEKLQDEALDSGEPFLDLVIDNIELNNIDISIRSEAGEHTRLIEMKGISFAARDLSSSSTIEASFNSRLSGQLTNRQEMSDANVTLSANADTSNWRPSTLDFQAKVRGANIKYHELEFADADLLIDLRATYSSESVIDWKRLTLRLNDGENIARLNSFGSYSLENGSLDTTIEMESVLLEPLETLALPNYTPEAGTLKGEFTLKGTEQFANISSKGELSFNDVQLRRLEKPVSDLSGEVSYVMNKAGSDLKIEDTDLLIRSASTTRLDGKVSADLSIDRSAESRARVSSKVIDIDYLLSMFSESEDKQDEIEANNKDQSTPASQDKKPVSVLLELAGVTYSGYEDTAIDGEVVVENDQVKLNSIAFRNRDSDLTLDGSIALTEDNTTTLSAQSNALVLHPPLSSVEEDGQDKLRGRIANGKLDLTTRGFTTDAFKNGATGSFYGELHNVDLNKDLDNYPPFNLLFLPFKVISKVGSFVPTGALPESILNIASGTKSILSDSQSIRIDRGTLELSLENGVVEAKKAYFDMNALPTVDMPGTVSIEGDVRINSAIVLIGQRLPLPIRGTLSVPYPDIPVFVTELVKSVGLLPLNTIKSTLGALNALNPLNLLSDDNQQPLPNKKPEAESQLPAVTETIE